MSTITVAISFAMLSIGFFIGFVTNGLVSGSKIIALDDELNTLRAKIDIIKNDHTRSS